MQHVGITRALSAWVGGKGGGGLLSFSVLGGTEKVAGLWFARGDQYPGWHYEWKSWIFSINFETNSLKNKNLYLKKIESATFLYKIALSEVNVKTNRMGSTKWTYHKERSFASIYFFFVESFSIRTYHKALIWSTNYPISHIHTFWKRWGFI